MQVQSINAEKIKDNYASHRALAPPIFASQMSDSLTIINPMADLDSDYGTCPEIPGHPIKLGLVNNMKTI